MDSLMTRIHLLRELKSLHINLCIVDQVLEWICTGVKITQLGVVGHFSYCGVKRSDHPADVHRLDVREVREDACPWSAGGLQIKTIK